MASSQMKIPLSALFGASILPVKTANATPANALNGGSAVFHGIEIDATANTGEDVYVRLANTSSFLVGTTKSNMVIKGKKGVKTTVMCKRGFTFSTDISLICVKEAGGGTGAVTNPSGTVNVRLLVA